VSGNQEPIDAILSALTRHAMEIVGLPKDERDAIYMLYRNTYIESAMELGMPCQEARQWAEQMNEWTRWLVTVIEQGGGVAGGNA
jgi:hypothetical protein